MKRHELLNLQMAEIIADIPKMSVSELMVADKELMEKMHSIRTPADGSREQAIRIRSKIKVELDMRNESQKKKDGTDDAAVMQSVISKSKEDIKHSMLGAAERRLSRDRSWFAAAMPQEQDRIISLKGDPRKRTIEQVAVNLFGDDFTKLMDKE